MKRRLALAATIGAPALALAAASPVLRLAWWGGAARHEATLRAVAAFERNHPGLRIKAEYMGFNGYLERLTTQIAGGSEPDVMQINWAWLAMFSKRGNGFTDHRVFLDEQQPHRSPAAAVHRGWRWKRGAAHDCMIVAPPTRDLRTLKRRRAPDAPSQGLSGVIRTSGKASGLAGMSLPSLAGKPFILNNTAMTSAYFWSLRLPGAVGGIIILR